MPAGTRDTQFELTAFLRPRWRTLKQRFDLFLRGNSLQVNASCCGASTCNASRRPWFSQLASRGYEGFRDPLVQLLPKGL